MLGDLFRRIESGSWKFIWQSSPKEAVPKPASRKFGTPKLPRCDRTSDPYEHTTAYTCSFKGSDL